jgi:hypothetical protein
LRFEARDTYRTNARVRVVANKALDVIELVVVNTASAGPQQ